MENILRNQYGEGEAKMSRGCKPDYENMIKEARKNKERAETLWNAIFNYTRGRSQSTVLATMVGELAFEIKDIERAIERMIEQQEQQ